MRCATRSPEGCLFSLDDGMVMANEGAGLGLEIDETALRRWRV